MTDIQKALVGNRITQVVLDPHGEYMDIYLQGLPVVKLNTYGDCCSHTWIENVDNPKALLGVVQAVEDIDMPDLGSIDGQRYKGVEHVSYYGLKIETNKGTCVIDYRNDSNGYYGGSLEVANEN